MIKNHQQNHRKLFWLSSNNKTLGLVRCNTYIFILLQWNPYNADTPFRTKKCPDYRCVHIIGVVSKYLYSNHYVYVFNNKHNIEHLYKTITAFKDDNR